MSCKTNLIYQPIETIYLEDAIDDMATDNVCTKSSQRITQSDRSGPVKKECASFRMYTAKLVGLYCIVMT